MSLHPEKLTDSQLLSLAANSSLAEEIILSVKKELKLRGLEFPGSGDPNRSSATGDEDKLPKIERIIILFFPFFPIIQTFISNRHLSKGKMNSWKQHWIYVQLGFLLWLIVILVFVWLTA